MATLTKTLSVFGLVATVFTGSSFADTYHHIDQLALTVARQSRQIVGEVHRHYRHVPEYRHLVSDAVEMARLADHIHDLAHHHGSLAHLESDLTELDHSFHHLESVFDRVEDRAAFGHGHIHGHTAHVKRLLNCIEDSIHHLQADLRSLRHAHHPRRPVVVQRPLIPTVPHPRQLGGHSPGFDRGFGRSGHSIYGFGTPSRGFSIGGGSSRFTFRF